MAMRTIQCALSAPLETRKRLWNWTEKYTLLINALLESVAIDSRFPEWLLNGEVPQKTLKNEFIVSLKNQSDYADLPGRFYDSAKYITYRVYKSWFAIQAKNYRRLEGKKRWLRIVESEAIPSDPDGYHARICQRASQWLVMAQAQSHPSKEAKARSSILVLMEAAEAATDSLDRQAIIHLLLNNLEVNETPISPQVLTQRFTKKRIQIERLEAQLHRQLPKGRDPFGLKYLDSLARATTLPQLPHNDEQLEEELKNWRKQAQISSYNPLHYPVNFLSADSLYWSEIQSSDQQVDSNSRKHRRSQNTRIEVSFKGFKKDVFKILCDRRQLYIFQRLLEEWQIYAEAIKENKRNPKVIPPALGLFPLRAAELLWRPDPMHSSATEPWTRHRLYLSCTIDSRLLTAEGTEVVRQSKLAICHRKLQKQQQSKNQSLLEKQGTVKVNRPGLTKDEKCQQTYYRQTTSSVQRLERPPLKRPHEQAYIGNPDLVMGVSLSRNPPLLAAIVNSQTQMVMEYRSAPQLLDQRLRCQPQQRRNDRTTASQQHLIQRQHSLKKLAERARKEDYSQGRLAQTQHIERLGLYLDRVLAKRLVEWAAFCEVGRIVLPRLEGIREVVESDVRAKARLKYPHYIELQKTYAKSFRASFHHWSYARLTNCIMSCAVNNGIPCDVRLLTTPGNLRERAIQITMLTD